MASDHGLHYLSLSHLLDTRHKWVNARLDVNNARLDVKSRQTHLNMKSSSRAPGHSVCSKSLSRTITLQGFHTHSYHRFREIHINARLDKNNARLDIKS